MRYRTKSTNLLICIHCGGIYDINDFKEYSIHKSNIDCERLYCPNCNYRLKANFREIIEK